MNSIRISDSLPRVWLEVVVKTETENNYTVASTFFDGTPFSITVPKFKVEVNPTDNTKGLLEVGKVGNGFGYIEVVLPAPSLQFGHQARVLPQQLVHPNPQIKHPTKYKKEE